VKYIPCGAVESRERGDWSLIRGREPHECSSACGQVSTHTDHTYTHTYTRARARVTSLAHTSALGYSDQQTNPGIRPRILRYTKLFFLSFSFPLFAITSLSLSHSLAHSLTVSLSLPPPSPFLSSLSVCLINHRSDRSRGISLISCHVRAPRRKDSKMAAAVVVIVKRLHGVLSLQVSLSLILWPLACSVTVSNLNLANLWSVFCSCTRLH